jgi:hypothetical protein
MVHELFHSCEEDIAASLAISLNRVWALMYCHAWGFEYSNKKGTIGEKLHEGENDFFNNLKLYHGIEVKDQGVFPKENVRSFLSQNESEYPIIVYIVDLHCPWGPPVTIINRAHPVLIRAACDSGWSCMDPYLLTEHAVLTLDSIPESGSKICTVNVNDIYIVASLLESQIIDSSKNISVKESEANALYSDMSGLKSLDSEIVLYNGRVRSDLLDRLTYLSRRRKQYAKYIDFLGEMMQTQFRDTATIFHNLSDSWQMIYKKLMKSFCMSSWVSDKENLLNLLNRTLQQEIFLAREILAKGLKGLA